MPREPLTPPDFPRPQLSDGERVSSSVSSLALKPGIVGAQRSGAEPEASASSTPAEALERLTDAEVMLRAGAGDAAAFDWLLQKYRRAIIGFMCRVTRDQAVAEELAQEVFLRVYRSRRSYAAQARFTTWLYRIASNLAVNYARDSRAERWSRRVSLDGPDPQTGALPDLPDARPTAEQAVLRQERLAAIREQVHALPERQRLAVLMHKYQGLDYREIAAALKISESATKSLLFRAYETLREKLKEFVGEQS